MGVRVIHLDPHLYFGKMRLCHSGYTIKWVDDMCRYIRDNLGFLKTFDSQNLFCSPFQRTWENGLQEVAAWLSKPENRAEFVFIITDDQPHYTWNQTEMVVSPIVEVFGTRLFTPTDKRRLFQTGWPSRRELVTMGKQVLVMSQYRYGAHGGDIIFLPYVRPLWPKSCIKFFTRYPDCSNVTRGWFGLVTGESQTVGKFWDGTAECGILTPENTKFVMECGMAPEFDQVSPDLLASAVFSWAQGEPAPYFGPVMPEVVTRKATSTPSRCVAASVGDGRWYTQDCTAKLPYACQAEDDPDRWHVGKPAGPWPRAVFANSTLVFSGVGTDLTEPFGILRGVGNHTTAAGPCPQGWTLGSPSDGFQLKRLRIAADLAGVDSIWLNLRVEPT
jgi:hypothetical protein